jgi:hypothetical protein
MEARERFELIRSVSDMFREVIPATFFVSYNTLCTAMDQEITFHICLESSMEHVITLVFMMI